MCVSSLRGNREISPSARISKNPARIGKVMSRSR
jgi:hypothetical protein